MGTGALLEDQQLFFKELRRLVQARSKGKSAGEVQAGVSEIRAEIARNPRIARYVGDMFASQVAKAYTELTGRTFPDRQAEFEAQIRHVVWHRHGTEVERR
jgi:hypothetical protein